MLWASTRTAGPTAKVEHVHTPDPTTRRGPTRRRSPRPATSDCRRPTRRGEAARAWYRGPLVPLPTDRDPADGRDAARQRPAAHPHPGGPRGRQPRRGLRDRPAARPLAAGAGAGAGAVAGRAVRGGPGRAARQPADREGVPDRLGPAGRRSRSAGRPAARHPRWRQPRQCGQGRRAGPPGRRPGPLHRAQGVAGQGGRRRARAGPGRGRQGRRRGRPARGPGPHRGGGRPQRRRLRPRCAGRTAGPAGHRAHPGRDGGGAHHAAGPGTQGWPPTYRRRVRCGAGGRAGRARRAARHLPTPRGEAPR